MTQEELAFKLGYKSKSTINKIETGINELSQTKIVAFATALQVTPEYLMGWTEEDERQATVEEQISGLSDEELNKLFMQLIAGKDKDYLLRLASQILEIASSR